MRLVTYDTRVGPGVDRATGAEFGREVDRVLADPRGWRKYGYRFERVTGRPDVAFRLETARATQRSCLLSGLSCQTGDEIVIHEDNWRGGSRSRLPLEGYRNYLVSHEMGHALGLPHRACPIAECRRRGLAACPASVMQQMTRGPDHVAPCVEAEWPLDPDWLVDDPRRLRCGLPTAAVVALLALLAALVALMLAAGCTGAFGKD
jgi:hypothetical protein